MEGNGAPGAWNFGGVWRQGRKVLCCGFLRPQEQKSAGGALQGDGAFDGKPFLRSGQPYFHGGIRCGMCRRRSAGRQHTDQADPAGRPDEGYVKPFRACGQAVPQLPAEHRIFPDLCKIRLFQPVEGFI